MKIVVASDSFKESLSSLEVASYFRQGWEKFASYDLEFDVISMADGGEGTSEALQQALDTKEISVPAHDPLMNPITASMHISRTHRTAVIDVASASGLDKIPAGQRDPAIATSYGTGELIKACLDYDVDRLLIGLGGSGTNDGGAGMLQALGGKLLDANHQELPYGGQFLKQLEAMDMTALDPRLEKTEIIGLCDVNNPLTGPWGASYIFGPQKGASKETAASLEEALSTFGRVLNSYTHKAVSELPYMGAAGGLASALEGCLKGRLEPGIQFILKESNFYERVRDASLVITGEGKIDYQSGSGKTPVGVARAVKEVNPSIPVIAICGQLGEGFENVYEEGITAVFSISEGPSTLQKAVADSKKLIAHLAGNLSKFYGQIIK
ncbi:glycerate kinase [Marinococcus halotolerans]|uniref:glycerate kinase n=1 Tax=Marinococcus halotolerans TaxID=301092 RepID=UPI0003B76754|nr:glycerate kinase [Marinococcus halotolerans]